MRHNAARRGSLLVVTLWVVSLLSVLAVAMARYLSLEVRLTKYRLAREQAKTLARSGVYLSMQRLRADAQQPNEGYDCLGDEWAAFEPVENSAGDRVEIQMIDEERKLNLNRIAADSTASTAFASLLGVAGLPEELADYVDPDKEERPNGLEEDPAAQPPYEAKNAALVAHEEVLDIPGWPAETLPAMRQWSTVADPASPLNINTVSVELFAALGFSQATAQALVDCRQQTVFEDQTQIVNIAQDVCGLDPNELNLLTGRFVVASQTFTVISTGVVARPSVKAQVEAIVQRSPDVDGTMTSKILSWRE